MKTPKSQFSKDFIQLNQLDQLGFHRWIFKQGMQFNQIDAWWQTRDCRPASHEGIDLCSFETGKGREFALEPGNKVPTMYGGEVVQIFDDFLGKSIQIAHDYWDRDKRLHSIYAHIVPRQGLCPGDRVEAGGLIAKIAATDANIIDPHLHISVLLISSDFTDPVCWESIHRREFELCDPLDFMD